MSLAIVQKVEGYLVNPELRKRMLALAEQDVRKLERILVVAQKVVARDPKLQECTPESIVQAITDAVEIGLEPSGFNGDAYLIPRKRNYKDAKGTWQTDVEAHLQLSYKGEAVLAGENGWEIHADVICEGDRYEIQRGAKPKLIHEYAKFGTRGDPLYFYAVATQVTTGFVKWECLEKDEVDHIRDTFAGFKGEAPKAGPWVDHYMQMGKKTAIHRLKNLLPLSPKQRRAREMDGEFYNDDSETVRGRVVPANEQAGARVPPAASVNGGSDSPGSAAGGEVAPTPSTPSPAPAPVVPPKKNSKVKAAMDAAPAVESPCPDCIPASAKNAAVWCVKHRSVTDASRPQVDASVAERMRMNNEPAGQSEVRKIADAGRTLDQQRDEIIRAKAEKAGAPVPIEDPGPCELTEGCQQPDGHPGASAGRCVGHAGGPVIIAKTPDAETGAIAAIVEAATNSGNPCKKTAGCILDAGHPDFCKGKGAKQAGGLFKGQA